MTNYNYPNPYSFFNVKQMDNMIKKEKENFKKEELEKEETNGLRTET